MKQALLLILTALISSFSPVRAEAAPDKFKIGISIPLTGSGSMLGVTTKQGFELYLDQHPEFASRVQVIVEDTTVTNINQGVNATKKLIEVDRVQALVQEISPIAFAMANEIDKEQVPTIAITGADCARNREYMVKLWLPLKNETFAIKKLLAEKKYQRIAVVTSEQESMLARTRMLKEGPDALTLIADETTAGENDSRPLALRLLKLKPDVVILNLMNGHVGPLAKRLREVGYQGDFISNTVVDDPAEIALSGGALQGAYYPMAQYSAEFVEAHKKRYGTPPLVAAANGYDAANLIHTVLKKLNWKYTPQAFNREMRIRDFQGAMGSYSFSFDEWNVYDVPATLYRVP